MLRRSILAIALTIGFAMPGAAFDIGAMTDAERQEFRAQIRDYLMENPEVLLEAIAVLEARQAAEQAAGDGDLIAANAEAIFNDGHSFVGGNPDGDITIVEFLDYRCGFCKRAHPEVKELLSSDGNIRYIVKEFPILGDQSVLASRFAIAVQMVEGETAYAKVNSTLMTFRGNISEESLSNMAAEMGFDAAEVFEIMNGDAVKTAIESNRALAQRLQINGTPSFVFENQMLRGYVPLDGMRQVVDEIRAEKS